ncbi:MAG: hypothetical protein ACRCWF_04735 [Beijerinckiaceae bacterium]
MSLSRNLRLFHHFSQSLENGPEKARGRVETAPKAASQVAFYSMFCWLYLALIALTILTLVGASLFGLPVFP